MRHTLDNGLTIIFREHHAARVVALQAWIAAGSADELEHESGLAHLHEHLLFKGTARRGPSVIEEEVEGAGGSINAWTGFDQTVFQLVVASSELETGLDVLADALQNAAFDPAALEHEKVVILEEMRQTYSQPIRRTSRALFDLAYQTHPYRRPVIGSAEAIRSHGRDEVMGFYRKHYRPGNVTLVVAGDVDPAAVLPRIEACFGGWPAGAPAPHELARHPEPPQRSLRTRVMHEAVPACFLEMAWHIPNLTHPDAPALDVAAVVLGQGESSRLITALRRRRALAADLHAYSYAPKDPGLLFLSARFQPHALEEVVAQSLDAAWGLRDGRVSEDELDKAKTIIESDGVYQHETVQGQARRAGLFQILAGNPRFEQEYYRRVRRVTAEDVTRVLEHWVSVDRLSAALTVPAGASIDEEGLARLIRGTTTEPRRSVRRRRPQAEVVQTALASGVRLLVKPEREVPLVSMRGTWVGGLRAESEEDNGVSLLASHLVTAGTEVRSAEELSRQLDDWAASMEGLAGRNSFSLGAEFLSRYLERAVRVFCESLTRPAFREDEVDRERARQLDAIRARDQDPAEVVFTNFGRSLWRRHPYRLDLRGTADALGRMDGERLRAIHARRYPLDQLHLAVVGDVDPDRVRGLLEDLLPGPTAPSALLSPPSEPAPVEPVEIEQRVAGPHAHLLLGFHGVRLSDPERYPLEVLAAALSGQSGRLFTELRERRALVYQVSATSVEGLDPGYFGVYLATRPEALDVALGVVRTELERIREEGVAGAHLERVKRYLAGTHEIGLQRAGHRATVLAFNEAYGLGHGVHREYADRIRAVDQEDVQAAAQRYLDPRGEVVSLVRP